MIFNINRAMRDGKGAGDGRGEGGEQIMGGGRGGVKGKVREEEESDEKRRWDGREGRRKR